MAQSVERVVVVGASAGGVMALSEMVRGLVLDRQAAAFVVVHIPASGRSLLAEILQKQALLPVTQALHGQSIQPGHIYVAPPDRHLMIERGSIRLSRGPKECRSRPSVDVLFRSAALAYGPAVVGVILSGTLDDGTSGLWTVKDRGGVALVQDPDTAEYDGMPASAISAVEVDAVVPISRMASEVERRLHMPVPLHPGAAAPSQLIENEIAAEGNALELGVMELGSPSPYTCPDCRGVLMQITEAGRVKFRCHTGHAFSQQTLLADTDEMIDNTIWDALRCVEERILLLKDMARRSAVTADTEAAERFDRLIRQAEAKVEPLRRLVLDAPEE